MRVFRLTRSLLHIALTIATLGAGSLLANCGGGGTAPALLPIAIPPAAEPKPAANAGATVVIPIPSPAPILCSPSPVTVSVGQTVTVNCSGANYIGPFTTSIADPAIASLAPANAQNKTLFHVTGVSAGTTQLLVSHTNPTTTAADFITVIP